MYTTDVDSNHNVSLKLSDGRNEEKIRMKEVQLRVPEGNAIGKALHLARKPMHKFTRIKHSVVRIRIIQRVYYFRHDSQKKNN